GLFDEIYPLGKTCNTSSIWENGKFTSRQSHWWDNLQGCFHKHFLMLGQSHIEKLLDSKLREISHPVQRKTTLTDIQVTQNHCLTTLSSGEIIKSNYIIGADGSHSFVRNHFHVGFEITRPQITWAVIDAEIETTFNKVPEIIVFQAETSDVAWIPREGSIDRFYIRMDRKDFSIEECLEKINHAMTPHTLSITKLEWFSQFTVKESVAESFNIQNCVFLAGDACHIHSVNGGQGLNTGLADAFNLIWKLAHKLKYQTKNNLLQSYEDERKSVAQSVINTSGELVRSTKYSKQGTHAKDYVRLVEKKSGNITGMGIQYNNNLPDESGERLHDIAVFKNGKELRLYQLLNYSSYWLINFSDKKYKHSSLKNTQQIMISMENKNNEYWSPDRKYKNKVLLVRPDSYIEKVYS
ncbi:FAD-binding protein, partial [Bacteriovoracaceae bacterium]|nr:FAD-binding protein [Bacteriovoracaceae bacterium]